MDAGKRITLCRLIEQMNENENCSKRLGLKNTSDFLRTEQNEDGVRQENSGNAEGKEKEENVAVIICSIDDLCVC